jgi:hypothetical protein
VSDAALTAGSAATFNATEGSNSVGPLAASPTPTPAPRPATSPSASPGAMGVPPTPVAP